MRSQCEQILAAMKAGEVITPLRAFQLTGSLACHSRIAELREAGNTIICTIKSEGRKRYGEYRLLKTDLFA